MKRIHRKAMLLGLLAFIIFGMGGCGSSNYAPSSTSGYVGYSYGAGFYDPWYRHGYYGRPIYVNPPSRPKPDRPVHLPARPVTPRPTPMPRR